VTEAPEDAEAERVYRAKPHDDEIADVLEQRLTATVGTVNADGSVHLAYVIFLFADGRLYFETASMTRKARNAAERGHLSMIVQGQARTGRHLMVAAEGTARVLDGDEARQTNHRLRAKYIKPSALADIDRSWNRLDDIAVELTPQRWRSWTGSVLHDVTSRQLSVPYADVWL
jgi:PPOX class probable F420-dependent enzyme